MSNENSVNQENSRRSRTMKLAKMGMLAAISLILVNIHFPIFPVIAFMEYDPADIPILIGTFAFGPMAGLLITLVTSIIQGVTVSAAAGVYGIIMHIIATGTYVIMAGFVYQYIKSKKGAITALVLGTIAMTIMMVGANYIVTPAFMNVPRDAITALLPFIIGFNLIKAGANGVITFFVYKRVSRFLHKN